MNTTTVILTNRARGYSLTPSPVIGWSNTIHGYSAWDDSQACMTFRLSLDEWRAIAFDVSRAVQRSRLDLWQFDVEVVEDPGEAPHWDGPEFRELLLSQLRHATATEHLDAIACSLDLIGQAFVQRAKELTGLNQPTPLPVIGDVTCRIVLTNRYLSPGVCSRFTGSSSAEYAHAMHEEALRRHVCRMPLEQWRQIKEDATRGFLRGPIAQWELDCSPASARFNEGGIAKVAAADTLDALRAIGEELSPILGLLVARAGTLAVPTPVEITEPPAGSDEVDGSGLAAPDIIHTEESLAAIKNYRQLLKAAKAAGVQDAEKLGTTDQLRAAILAHQGETSTQGAAAPTPPQAPAAPIARPAPGPGPYFDIKDPPAPKRPAFQGGNAS